MPKNYTQETFIFRVINSHWVCVDGNAYSGTLADFLHMLGIEFLPDTLDFARLRINDDFYIWIYQDALSVQFKLFNKPSNFLQNEQNP